MGSEKFGSPRGWLMVIKRHFNIQLFDASPPALRRNHQDPFAATVYSGPSINIQTFIHLLLCWLRIRILISRCSAPKYWRWHRITSSAHLSSVLQVSGFSALQPLFFYTQNNRKQMETRRSLARSLIKLWKIENFPTLGSGSVDVKNSFCCYKREPIAMLGKA